MFRTDLLSIIRSLNTIFTATGICHTGYVECLIARSLWNLLACIIRIYHDARSSECQIRDENIYERLTLLGLWLDQDSNQVPFTLLQLPLR